MTLKTVLAGLFVALSTQQLTAHELWIEAADWQVEAGEPIQADIRNGIEMEGPAYPWIDARATRAEVFSPDGSAPFAGLPGDLPAFQVQTDTPGLYGLIYETKTTRLTYDSFDLFREFTEEKGWPSVLEQHLAEGYPQENLAEVYDRHVKALIAVGDGAGEDAYRGMTHEIVTTTNPYTMAADQPMEVRVYHDDKPRPDARVTVFERSPEMQVDLITLQTDADGRASFPVKPGYDYLVDTVYLQRASAKEMGTFGAIWKSNWAALTFGVPAR
ncbi:DUF4198 domain-containing protein [Pseudooceanicola sp. MF1-13]|uniref:DUF4198 domain-containing protein n=1 Tax=Pseudooceanicola sp. MF1-13 TaxID=3379095 RepID=UPI003891477E